MERDFNRDDFENFLKQKSNQHKINPSEKTWKGIYNTLHPATRWFKIGGGLLILSGMFLLSHNMINKNAGNKQLQSKLSQNTLSGRVQNVIKPAAGTINTSKNTVRKNSRNINFQNKSITSENTFTQLNAVILPSNEALTDNTKKAYHQTNPVLSGNNSVNTENAVVFTTPSAIPLESSDNTTEKAFKLSSVRDGVLQEEINLLQNYTPVKLSSPKRKKLNLQFYFSPTISYRRLADNKHPSHFTQRNIPLASNYLNIDRFVDHNPSIGAEIGSNVLLRAGRNFTLKTGLQLNYSRYSIKAYRFYTEKASIALNTVGRIADTLTSYTSYRNFSGYSPENLQNQYLQVSVPVGAEVKLLGNRRLQLNIAGTIQPTYLLLSDTYLLSSDYVNYAQEPSLVRKWNVHTSLETFVSYKVGGLRWQVGPQFRYQLMSSYNDRYPIKEYLREYGFKFGVSKTLH